MKTLLSLLLLASVTLALPLDGCKVTDFGTPVRTATTPLQQLGSESVLTKACVIAAWAGTSVVLGSVPWWGNPKVQPIVQIAAAVGVAGLFGAFLTAAR